jgi:hypothetical protein
MLACKSFAVSAATLPFPWLSQKKAPAVAGAQMSSENAGGQSFLMIVLVDEPVVSSWQTFTVFM